MALSQDQERDLRVLANNSNWMIVAARDGQSYYAWVGEDDRLPPRIASEALGEALRLPRPTLEGKA